MRFAGKHAGPIDKRSFKAAAAQVGKQPGVFAKRDERPQRPVDKLGLFRSADDFQRHVQLLLRALDECSAVCAFPDRAGGDNAKVFDT